MQEQFIPFGTWVPCARITSREAFFCSVLYSTVWDTSCSQITVKQEKSSTCPLSKLLFTTFLLLLSNRPFWMVRCTEGPLFPLAFLDNRAKLQAQIRHTDVPHSHVKRALWDLESNVHRKDFRCDGQMGYESGSLKMIVAQCLRLCIAGKIVMCSSPRSTRLPWSSPWARLFSSVVSYCQFNSTLL